MIKPIQVTEPFLPPLEEYVEYLKGIWERNWLTNQGPLVRELELKLQAYHRLSQPVYCVANGGLGLQIIIKAMGLKGEVITTPFSYVATTSCPLWEGCSVRFADIEPDTLTLDPKAVEAAITPRTEAILATHVYGNPCDVEGLQAVASRHGLALIYDAAHAFGVTYKGKSILDYGDASMVSLHATKVFHSVEGGFITARDPALGEKMEWMRRFGHKDPGDYHGVGMNAKMTEFHAAMGLANFKHIDHILAKRKAVCEAYDSGLGMANREWRMANGECRPENPTADRPPLSAIRYREGASRNYAYYPVIFDTEEALLDAINRLNQSKIHPRRYFWPSLDEVESLGNQIAESRDQLSAISCALTRRILCLPLSVNLEVDSVEKIIKLLT